MAPQSSYSTIGIREDLVDKLVRTGDGEAPFLSALQKRTTVAATNKLHEWQDWALPAPTNNSAAEGFTPITASTARNRRSNRVQIFSIGFNVADSVLEGVDIAGIATEYKFQADCAFTRLRRDIEWAFLNNGAAVSGTSAVAATLAGPFSLISTNISSAASASSVYTESEFIASQRSIFAARGVQSDVEVFMAPIDVGRIMAFTGVHSTGKMQMTTETSKIHNRTVSIVVTNFGKMSIIPNQMLAAVGKMLFADAQTWALAVKVAPKLKALAKTTDSTSAYWKTELTLESLNESANSQISAIATA